MNFTISLIIYDFDVMVSLGESDKELFSRLKKLKIPKSEYTQMKMDCYGKYMMFSNKTSLIRLPKVPSTPREYGTLSHEILHCVIQIMRTVDIPLTESSEEAYTYLQGYLTQKILN